MVTLQERLKEIKVQAEYKYSNFICKYISDDILMILSKEYDFANLYLIGQKRSIGTRDGLKIKLKNKISSLEDREKWDSYSRYANIGSFDFL